MNQIFVDTSAVYALFVRDDINYSRATDSFKQLIQQDTPLVTHSFVVVELLALLQHRIGLQPVVTWKDDFEPLFDIIWVDKIIYSSALERLLALKKKKVSLVDCVSYTVMETHHLSTAFAFDPDFEAAGFKLLD